MIKKPLLQNLRTRPLSQPETIRGLYNLSKTGKLLQENHYSAGWITDQLWDLKHHRPIEGSTRIAFIQWLGIHGVRMTDELWDRFWTEAPPACWGRTLNLQWRDPTQKWKSSLADAPYYLTVSYSHMESEERWAIVLRSYLLGTEATNTQTYPSPSEYRAILEELLPAFGISDMVRFEERAGLLHCIVPAECQRTRENELNPQSQLLVSFGGGYSDVTRASEQVNVTTRDINRAKAIWQSLMEKFSAHEWKITEWSYIYQHENLAAAREWIPRNVPPPWKFEHSGIPERMLAPEQLAIFNNKSGEFWPMGYYRLGGNQFTVDALNLGRSPDEQWEVYFNAWDPISQKTREKAKAELEKICKIDRLFECEQLLERYGRGAMQGGKGGSAGVKSGKTGMESVPGTASCVVPAISDS